MRILPTELELQRRRSFTQLLLVSRYDDFGRLKKKFRAGAEDRKAREAAALARLHGLVRSLLCLIS